MSEFLRKNGFPLVTSVVLALVGVIALVLLNGVRNGSISNQELRSASGVGQYTVNSLTPLPQGTGIPMATPDPTQRARSPITGASALSLPVTEASIRQVLADPDKQGGLVHGSNVTVVKVQFMTAGEVYTLVKDPFINQFPSSEPVAYVTMTGDFPSEAPTVMHDGFAVFDVSTGNILMSGAH